MAVSRFKFWNSAALVLWMGLLSLPLAGHWLPWAQTRWNENRQPAPAVPLPTRLQDLGAYPAAAWTWADDHFGWRGPLLAGWHRLHYSVFGTLASREVTMGRDGFLFFGTDGLAHRNAVRSLCGADAAQGEVDATGAKIRQFMQTALAAAPRSHFLIVPDKARLSPEKLPLWLQRECAGFAPPMAQIMAAMARAPLVGARAFYPFETIVQAMQRGPVIPAQNFHWNYAGALPVAQWLAETRWGMARRFDVPLVQQQQESDLQAFFPGLRLVRWSPGPQDMGGQLLVCHNRPECFPEFAEAAKSLFQLARYRSAWQLPPDQRRPRLVIVGDSFGEGIAGPLAPYFAEVWYLSMNHLEALSVQQQQAVRHVALDLFDPDVVLHVYHEVTVLRRQDDGYFRRISELLTRR